MVTMGLARAVVCLVALFSAAGVALGQSSGPCETDVGFAREVTLDKAAKISVLEFEASVSYKYVAGAESGVLKVLSASAEPEITVEDGVVVISTAQCAPGGGASVETIAADSSALLPLAGGSLLTMMTRRFAPVALAFVFAASMQGALAQEGAACTPTVEIEITVPSGWTASATSMAEMTTDHYLEANSSTVRWGYYDFDAPAQAKMASGETITVEVVTHHSGHDYAKMIRGDPAVEGMFYWEDGTTLMEKPVLKPPGSGVHLITGPIEVEGAEPGDVVQVDILALDPRPNPVTGKTYGTNSQKFAGYQFRVGHVDGTPYTTEGGHEAITVFEFEKTADGAMAWAKPIYMYQYPNITDPAGDIRTYDNMPCVVIPHETNMGEGLMDIDGSAVSYPVGFDGVKVNDPQGIEYLDADLDWKVPLRPHIGTLGVMPANTDNYANGGAAGTEGANSIPPSKFGGNVDDWRIGKGGTMYYTVEVPGAMIVAGDTHAAQGDSELAGTAMETSMTAKLKVTLHKAGSLPATVANLNFPLLETASEYVVHGFAFTDYLDELETPSSIFQEGASLDMAMEDCFNKTRLFLMNGFGLTEEETIAMMSTGVDFGITQVVDGNWGVHADIEKWMFEAEGSWTPYDYSCTSPSRRRGLLMHDDRRVMLEAAGIYAEPHEAAIVLFDKVTSAVGCKACATSPDRQKLADKMLDAKFRFAGNAKKSTVPAHILEALENGHNPSYQRLESKFSGAKGKMARRSVNN